MLLTIHVIPKSKDESIEWVDDDTLKIHVRAIPEKGKANAAVIELLSRHFKIPKSSVEIVRGQTTKIKQVALHQSRLLKKGDT